MKKSMLFVALSALFLFSTQLIAKPKPVPAVKPQFLPVEVPTSVMPVSPPPLPQRERPKASPFDPNSANLEGLGKLIWVLNPMRFVGSSTKPEAKFEILIIWFDREGRPTDCQPIRGGSFSSSADEACKQFKANAMLNYKSAFAVPFQRGFMRVALVTGLEIVPTQQIQFSDSKHGYPITLQLVGQGSKPDCQVAEVLQGGITFENADRICSAFMMTTAAKTRRYTNGTAMKGWSVEIQAWIRLRNNKLATVARWFPDDPEMGIYPIYPDAEVAGLDLISQQEGRLESTIGPEDYPADALRNGLEGDTWVLLGIAGDGRVVSCRPIESSGYLLLDNTTCSAVQLKLRHAFNPGYGSYPGIRYRKARIRWQAPEV